MFPSKLEINERMIQYIRISVSGKDKNATAVVKTLFVGANNTVQ